MTETAGLLAAAFNRYFTSSNGVDVPERVAVPRDEWRKLFDVLKVTLADKNQSRGLQPGETIPLAALSWALWCERRDMTGLPEFLRHVSRVMSREHGGEACSDIESPLNACMHRSYCLSLKVALEEQADGVAAAVLTDMRAPKGVAVAQQAWNTLPAWIRSHPGVKHLYRTMGGDASQTSPQVQAADTGAALAADDDAQHSLLIGDGEQAPQAALHPAFPADPRGNLLATLHRAIESLYSASEAAQAVAPDSRPAIEDALMKCQALLLGTIMGMKLDRGQG